MLRDGVLLPGLRDYGFEAEGYRSAMELYRGMLSRAFDIVLLDIDLPGESGLSIAAHLREIRPGLGIVILTGSDDRKHQVRAMRNGADVYLSKPADIEVIAFSLHSLARRLRYAREGGEKAGAFVPSRKGDADAWKLASDGWFLQSPAGQILALTAPERSLLMVLDARRGHPVARERLIAALTADVSDFDPHRLEALVYRIRRKAVSAVPNEPPLPLLSVRGKGYVLTN